MLAQLKSTLAQADRAELTARLTAWWDGSDYTPGQASKNAEGSSAAKVERRRKPRTRRPAPPPPPRIKALETLWGRGRYGPSTGDFNDFLLNTFGFGVDAPGDIGMLGADAMLGAAAEARFGGYVKLADWRDACTERSRHLSQDIDVVQCDLDRLRVFVDEELAALLSIDAFSFADHKAGLAARVFRALKPGGRWVAVDYARAAAKTPAAAFASSWIEPQLPAENGLRQVLETTGFTNIERRVVTAELLEAAARGFERLTVAMEDAVAAGKTDRQGVEMLQELSWEAESWRMRVNALKGGALVAEMWIADKPGGAVQLAPAPEAPVDDEADAAPAEDQIADAEPEADPEPQADAEPAATDAEPAEELDESADWGLDEDEEAEAMDQGAVDSLFD